MWTRFVLILLWLAFGAAWVRVARQTTLHELVASLRLLFLLTLAYSLVLLAWVLHNVSIFRRKGPRKGVRESGIFPNHDYLGVPVDIRVDCLSEPEVVIDLVEGTKRYLPQQAVLDHSLFPLSRAVSDAAHESEEAARTP
jgi:hypothetical protein